MPAGKVAPHNTRTNITISKELKAKLEEIAKTQNRSFNNLVISILKDYADALGMTTDLTLLKYFSYFLHIYIGVAESFVPQISIILLFIHGNK